MLNQPEGLAVAPDGTLYIADFQNNRVREVLPNGTIRTVAGDGGRIPETVPTDGLPGGAALEVHLWSPSAVAIGPGGALYIAATNENAIVELHRGTLTTVLTGDDLRVLNRVDRTEICGPAGLAFDERGDLYFDCSYDSALLMRTPAGSVVYRGNSEQTGFSQLSTGGGDEVVDMTTGGILGLTPTGRATTPIPALSPRIGVLSLGGIVARPGGTVYLDQGGSLDGGPPAIVAVRGESHRALGGRRVARAVASRILESRAAATYGEGSRSRLVRSCPQFRGTGEAVAHLFIIGYDSLTPLTSR